MKKLIYENTEVTIPSELMVERLRVLLPYWGMHLLDDTISPALLDKKVEIIGLSDKAMKDIDTSLAHTGVTLTSNSAHLTIHIGVSSNYSSSLAIQDNHTTYPLTPIHMQYAPVQTFIHKNIQLPSTHPSFNLFVHTNLATHIPEYVSYLILQHFLQEKFEKLNFPFTQYELLVEHVLTPINPTLSRYQQLEKKRTAAWPTPPSLKTKRTQTKSNETIEEAPSEQENRTKTISALHSDEECEEVTINPFKYDDYEESSSIFQPFRKK